jgi:hypothetical protein
MGTMCLRCLLTNVPGGERLSDAGAARLYGMRWGVELLYRSPKQVMRRGKMLSSSPDNAQVELDWSVTELCLLGRIGAGGNAGRIDVGSMVEGETRQGVTLKPPGAGRVGGAVSGAEWMAGTDPKPILESLKGRASTGSCGWSPAAGHLRLAPTPLAPDGRRAPPASGRSR